MEKVWDVVVVGAGIAGLIAARNLSDAGREVLVVEGRNRPGGRTYYRNFAETTQKVELGANWISRDSMPAIMAEVTRYGIELVEQAACTNFAWVTGGERRPYAPIPPEEFGAAEKALAAFHEAMKRTPGGQIIDAEDYSDLDVPVSEWPPFADLPDATREFVFAWASMYGGCDADSVSVLHFTRLLAEFGGNVAALFFGLSHRFADGTLSLISAIEGSLPRSVEYSTKVIGIEQGDIVTVRTDQGEILARQVVCTVPVNSLHRVEFSPPLPELAASMSQRGMSSKCLKSWSLCRNVPEGFMGVGWNVGLEWVISMYSYEDGTSLVCSFGFDTEAVDLSDRTSVQSALSHYIPEIEVLAVDWHDWNSDEFSDGTHMIGDPGWVTSGEYRAFLQPHGAVHFAGADHSLSWTGWLEGAVMSGSQVAVQVDSRL